MKVVVFILCLIAFNLNAQNVDIQEVRNIHTLLEAKDFTKLIEICDQKIDENESAFYHQVRGIAKLGKYENSYIKWKNKNLEEARLDFNKSLELDPENADKALTGLILSEMTEGNFETAKTILEESLEKYDKSVHLNFVGIEVYEKLGDPTKSIACENRVYRLDPEYKGHPVFLPVFVAKIAIGAFIRYVGVSLITGYVAGYLSAHSNF